MHLNSVQQGTDDTKKSFILSLLPLEFQLMPQKALASLQSFINSREREMHEFPEPTSYRLHQDLYLLQLPFSATPPAKIWVLPQLIELRNIIQTSFKNCRRKTIRKSSLGRGREVDLPLPKAVESCSLEGIYPKWPNFPKIVLWRPKGVKSGKPKQNNKHTAPY